MNLYHFVEGRMPRLLPADAELPLDGLVWADFVRSEAEGWECWAEPQVGVPIEAQHVADSLSANHPSFFDGTSDYDMLIFQGLGPRDDPFPIETRTATFFLFQRYLITVRAADNLSFGIVQRKLDEGRIRHVPTVVALAHLVLDTMVDRYLRIRDPLDQRFTELQDRLLDADTPQRDWRSLLRGRRVVRELEALSEGQLEALDAWRRNTCFQWGSHDVVKVRDLVEHVTRVLAHASGQERDIEAAVQLHFAIATGRTNRVVQILTVLSAIFFPLTLITGIYGMNFDNMPELHWHYGYYWALGLLLAVGFSLYLLFRRRRLL